MKLKKILVLFSACFLLLTQQVYGFGFGRIEYLEHSFDGITLLLDDDHLISLGMWGTPHEPEKPVTLYNLKTKEVTELPVKLNLPKAVSLYMAARINKNEILLMNRFSHDASIYDIPSQKFRLVGKTKFKHYNSEIIPMDDGRVFIMTQGVTEIYDPKTEEFTKVGERKEIVRHLDIGDFVDEYYTLHPYRYSKAVKLNDGRILIVGNGYSVQKENRRYTPYEEIYNPKSNKFEPCAKRLYSRGPCSLTLLPDGRVLIAGGFASSKHGDVAEIYNPITDTFTATGKLQKARYSHCAILLKNGKVLIVNGRTPTFVDESKETTMELYDPKSGKFKCIGHNNVPRSFAPYIFHLGDNKIIISGSGKVEIFKYRRSLVW